MAEQPPNPEWEERADGSRVRYVNGIRIIDHTAGPTAPPGPIEHLVAVPEVYGRVVILGLDADGRAVYTTTLFRRR
jgi:hypothetical protein